MAGLHVGILPAIAVVEIGVACLDGQLAAFRHGVAGIHREVENGGFELGRVGLDRPHAAAADNLERNVLAERAAQKIGQAVEHAIDVEQGGTERLLAGKGQEPFGQRRRALRAVHGVFQPARKLDLRAVGPALQLTLRGFEVADDDRQQIVEVVRDAAGQVADGVEFLRLAQRFLGGGAAIDLGVKPLRAEQHGKQAEKQEQGDWNAVDQVRGHAP